MNYKIEFTNIALKNIRKVDVISRKQILKYITDVLSKLENPRLLGKALTGNLGSFWRYRVGHFRLLCEIQDNKLTILVVKIAHRKDVY
jgi:mRNA interferase RelE/StbE